MTPTSKLAIASVFTLCVAYVITVFFPRSKPAVIAAIIASPIPPIP
jgi:hypothetical protein